MTVASFGKVCVIIIERRDMTSYSVQICGPVPQLRSHPSNLGGRWRLPDRTEHSLHYRGGRRLELGPRPAIIGSAVSRVLVSPTWRGGCSNAILNTPPFFILFLRGIWEINRSRDDGGSDAGISEKRGFYITYWNPSLCLQAL